MLLIKAGSSAGITNVDQLATLIDLARGYSLAQTKTFINSIRATSEQLRQNANPQLALEVLMLSVPEADSAARLEVNYG